MKPKKLLKAGVMLATCLAMACSPIMLAACQPVTEPDGGGVLPHKHIWDEGEVTKAATCTENGVLTQHCTVTGCEQTNLKQIYAAHNWSEPVVVEATCEHGGSTTTECSACHEKEVETSFRTPHNIVDGVCTMCGQGPSTSLGSDEIAFVTDKEDGYEDLKKITENFDITGTVYKVYASEAKDMRLSNDANTTVEDRHFTRSVYFNGKANLDGEFALSRVLEATYTHSGAVTVYLRKNTATQMNVWVKEGEVCKVFKEYPFGEDQDAHVWEFEVNAGTYYFGTTTGSASIYGIDFEEKDVAVHIHDYRFSEYKTGSEPSCYADGIAIHTCRAEGTCDEPSKEVAVPRAHTYEEGSETCSVCGIDTTASIDFSQIPATISSDTEVDSIFTIMAGKGLSVKTDNKSKDTVNGVQYERAFHFDGKLADDFGRSIKITMPSKGGITVVVKKDSSDTFKIVDSTGTTVASTAITEKAKVWTVEITEAGVYYIGTDVTGSAYLFDVTVEYIAPEHVHSYDTLQTTTKAADCHTDGEGVYVCSCGETETKTIKSSGHDLDDNDFCSNCNNYVKSLDLSQVEKGNYEQGFSTGTITSFFCKTGDAAKPLKVIDKNATVDGKNYETAVDLGGTVHNANGFQRGIKIEMPAAGTIYVVVQISDSKKVNTNKFVSYLDETLKQEHTFNTANAVSMKFTVEEAGDYYIGTNTGGAYVYDVIIECATLPVPDTDTETDTDTPIQETALLPDSDDE